MNLPASTPYLDALREAINRHDPQGLIEPGFNEDEYDAERDDLADALPHCLSEEGALMLVHSVFLHGFGSDAGDRSRYEALAEDLWEIERARRSERPADDGGREA